MADSNIGEPVTRYCVWCEHTFVQPVYDLHRHIGTEAILIADGEADIEADGVLRVVRKNQVLIIDRLHKHSIVNVRGHYEQYSLIFQSDLFLRSKFLSATAKSLLSRLCGCGVIDVSSRATDVRHIFDFYHSNWKKPKNELELEYDRCSAEQLLIILSQCCTVAEPKRTAGEEEMYRIKAEIDSRFADDISVSDLAHRHFINEDHLIHEFKRVTGYTPWQYIIMSRLVYSQNLLTTTDDPISLIAFKCGFGNESSYIRSFRKQYAVSPGQYRKKNKNPAF